MNLSLPLEEAPVQRPLTVGEVVRHTRDHLEAGFPSIWVEGEVANSKRHSKGHWYFSLMEGQARLDCVMFSGDQPRGGSPPADGIKVFARGRMSVSPRGSMQLIVGRLLETTEGGFRAIQLERARRALERDGLLEPSRKRPLPGYPQRIGVVTSRDGAVWGDIKSVVGRRWPLCELVLIGTLVQGEEAPAAIVRALAAAEREQFDVLIVGRGGGSRDDLWAFNDEAVARAVAASRAPTIAAIGHQMDVTLTDLVADVSAPTPSAAAEKAVPDMAAVLKRLDSLARHLDQAAMRRLEVAEVRLGKLEKGMRAACQATLKAWGTRAERLAASLDALSPLRVLERGYSVARDTDGTVLRRTADFPVGRRFVLRVVDGEVPSRVEGAT